MASAGESGCCHGGQHVASGKAHTEGGGFQGIQPHCLDDTKNRRSG